MSWRSAAALVAGCFGLALIIYSVGPAAVLADLMRSGWVLPAMSLVHLGQLLLSALAWRESLGGAGLRWRGIFQARWIREGVNALLPVAQIGGQVAGAAVLVRLAVPPVLAVAGTILDLTLEAAAQLVYTLAGMGVLLDVRADRGWLGWVGGGVALTGLGVAGFVAAQRAGLLIPVERLLERMARQWPVFASWPLEGLHATLMRRQGDGRAVLRAMVLHTTSWALGSAEVWIALWAMGRAVSLPGSFVIESLAMAARSAGFAVPGAIGVQEGGFVLVCGLFGVPAEMAVSLSVLKRVREILVGVPALLVRSG